MYDLAYVITYTWNLKCDGNQHIYRTKTDSQMQRADLCSPRTRGMREGWNASLELADANYYIWDGEITRSYFRAEYRTIV